MTRQHDSDFSPRVISSDLLTSALMRVRRTFWEDFRRSRVSAAEMREPTMAEYSETRFPCPHCGHDASFRRKECPKCCKPLDDYGRGKYADQRVLYKQASNARSTARRKQTVECGTEQFSRRHFPRNSVIALVLLSLGIIAVCWRISPRSRAVWSGDEFHQPYLFSTILIAGIVLSAINYFALKWDEARAEHKSVCQNEMPDVVAFAIFCASIFLLFCGGSTLNLIQAINPAVGSLVILSVAIILSLSFSFDAMKPDLSVYLLAGGFLAGQFIVALLSWSPTSAWIYWVGSPVRFASTIALGCLFYNAFRNLRSGGALGNVIGDRRVQLLAQSAVVCIGIILM